MKGMGASAALILALIGCQTTKPALVAPAESAIGVEKSGFSPASTTGQTSIGISLLFGNGESIDTWKVEVMSSGIARKTWTGNAGYLPAGLTWDGKSDSGVTAPEGTYTATLSIDYKEKYQAVSASSKSFILDITPATGTISMDPAQFTPTEKGVEGPVTLTINAASALARMDSWSMDVLDPAGGVVKSWTGRWPDASATWDGSSQNGGFVTPSTTYKAVATVSDEYGNTSKLNAEVAVAALPQKPAVVAAAPAAAVTPAPAVASAPPQAGQPAISPGTSGFSPNADHPLNTIALLLTSPQPSAVASWKVTISAPGAGAQKTFSGNGPNPPASVVWDGKSDSGALAPEGSYTATFDIDYGTAYAAGTATSPAFILDVTPPSGSIVLSSPLFSPLESTDTISLKLSARSNLAKIDSWSIDIRDPAGNTFRSFTGTWPINTAVWDGRNESGELVQSAEDYPVVAKVRDQFGNTGTVKTVVPIDVLVEKTAEGYRILASRIFFKAFTADYQDVSKDLAAQNMLRLDALAAKLKKFPGYKIRIIGHAVMINWNNPTAGAAEQKAILIPLSKARADAVERALVQRGLEEARFTTDGVGASDQLVPDSDYKDRWENRRVALFLEKESGSS